MLEPLALALLELQVVQALERLALELQVVQALERLALELRAQLGHLALQ